MCEYRCRASDIDQIQCAGMRSNENDNKVQFEHGSFSPCLRAPFSCYLMRPATFSFEESPKQFDRWMKRITGLHRSGGSSCRTGAIHNQHLQKRRVGGEWEYCSRIRSKSGAAVILKRGVCKATVRSAGTNLLLTCMLSTAVGPVFHTASV